MDELFGYEIKDEAVCITKYVGSSNEVVIPEKIEGYSVTSIGGCAFWDNALTSIDLSGVESIGENAFSYNILTSIDLLGVKSIGNEAFLDNELTSIDLSGVKSIDNRVFEDNDLTSVDLTGVESIGIGAFFNNNLTSIDLTGVKSIGNYAFKDNNLEAIILPEKFRARTKEIFNFDEEELDNRNKKYVKKYVDKMRELYIKKLYKNSRKHGLIFEYITYYIYRESYSGSFLLEEAVALP